MPKTHREGLCEEMAPRFLFSRKLARVNQSPLREILPQASQPGVISLALGMPAGELFPRSRFITASEQVFGLEHSTQYGEPHPPLKKHIVRLMAERGVSCTEEQIFLTAGAQQGLSLMAQLLLNPGGKVITEDTIYDGLQMVLQASEARVLTVPTSLDSGMNIDVVEGLLERHRPAFIYAITDGHNPLGVSLKMENRKRLVELARQYRVPVLEDDAYGFLYYEGCRAPDPLCALDEEWVFYLGSFSKILAPALRVGWIVVPGELAAKHEDLTAKLSVLKQAADFDTATLVQRALSAYLDTGHLNQHIDTIRKEYRLRRDAMVEALGRHFPHEIRWNRPTSGLFLWIEMPPETLDSYALLSKAIEEKVAFLPGPAFAMGATTPANAHCMRLSFGNCSVEEIEEGVARLGRVVKRALSDLRFVAPNSPRPSDELRNGTFDR